MVTDLERIGDLAVNICERAIDLAAEPPLRSYDDIVRTADLVQSMVRDAIDAFVHADDVKAQDVDRTATTRSTSCTTRSSATSCK